MTGLLYVYYHVLSRVTVFEYWFHSSNIHMYLLCFMHDCLKLILYYCSEMLNAECENI